MKFTFLSLLSFFLFPLFFSVFVDFCFSPQINSCRFWHTPSRSTRLINSPEQKKMKNKKQKTKNSN